MSRSPPSPKWLLAATMCVACHSQDGLRVLAPSSLADVLPVIAQGFHAAGGPNVIISYAATSRIASQLEAGAPADLFISADDTWMADALDKGLVDADSVSMLATNQLVVVVPTGAADRPLQTLQDLTPIADRVAVASTQVPAGRYARAALSAGGVHADVTTRMLQGDNVRSVLAWVARGEAMAGIVYATDARVEPRVTVALTIPAATHPPINYPAAVTRHAVDPDAAAALIAYCVGPGAETFAAAGFVVPSGSQP